MQQLTAKQKFALIFSVTVFILTILYSGLFIGLYSLTLFAQTKRDLATELTNITENHLATSENTFSFVKDKTGNTLKQHLANTPISVVFFDQDRKVARAYGIFATMNAQREIQQLLSHISVEKRINTRVIPIAGEYMLFLGSPLLTSSGTIVGTIILTQSLSSIGEIVMSLIFICMGLSVISLIVSFLIGFVLMRSAFQKLDTVTNTVMKIDLNRLHHKITVLGHPSDEIVQLATKFNEMIERLHIMSQKQKEFIANASHELKTPLTRAITTIDALDHTDPSQCEGVRFVRSELFALSVTIDQLLLLAKLREHDAPIGETNILDATAIIQTQLENEFSNKGIRLNQSVNSELTIPMPESYAKVILSNIISNALKYSGPRQNIDMGALISNTKTTLWIEDHGIGMNEKGAKRIFDRFYRAVNSQGTIGEGIGLSLVKTICDMYSITVQITTKENQGTKISLSWDQKPSS